MTKFEEKKTREESYELLIEKLTDHILITENILSSFFAKSINDYIKSSVKNCDHVKLNDLEDEIGVILNASSVHVIKKIRNVCQKYISSKK